MDNYQPHDKISRSKFSIAPSTAVKHPADNESIAPPIPPVHQLPYSRPLSDIRELSEPSVLDCYFKSSSHSQRRQSISRQSSTQSRTSVRKSASGQYVQTLSRPVHSRSISLPDSSSSYSGSPDLSSFYNISRANIPRRSSSQRHAQQPNIHNTKRPSQSDIPIKAQESERRGTTIPNRGVSRSPVKQAELRLDAIESGADRRIPSRTFVRSQPPIDILEYPTHRHPRVQLELSVTAPLFVGGGSVEGSVKVTVDRNAHMNNRHSLAISQLSVDLLGFEETPSLRRSIFLAVSTDLLDRKHPPPADMVTHVGSLATNELFWELIPSVCSLPFMLSLPLDTGPPPFASKFASIRFLLSATALLRDSGKLYEVRTSKNISVLATYDPEKALRSLPYPLTTSETLSLRHFGRIETLRLTAGLHRQVWVSGSSIFVDVHIVNKTHKQVKKLELSLERDILCYKHPPASAVNGSENIARISEINEKIMIARTTLKSSNSTAVQYSVEAHHSETKTCELEVPRGHATVRCGKYFEVRFFLNIAARSSSNKSVEIQLPIILIHMNSLDVVPNCIAQVAAAIEEKRRHDLIHRNRSRRHIRSRSRREFDSPAQRLEIVRRNPSYSQGRAFAAPRQQSTDEQRARQKDINELKQALDASPRKHFAQPQHPALRHTQSDTDARTVGRDVVSNFDNIVFRTPPQRQRRRDVSTSHDLPSIPDIIVDSPTKLRSRVHIAENAQVAAHTMTPLAPDLETKVMHNLPFDNFPLKQVTILTHHSPTQLRSSKPAQHNTKSGASLEILRNYFSTKKPAIPESSTQAQTTTLDIKQSGARPSTSLGISRPSLSFSRSNLSGGLGFIRRQGTSGSLRERGRAWLAGRVGKRDVTAAPHLSAHPPSTTTVGISSLDIRVLSPEAGRSNPPRTVEPEPQDQYHQVTQLPEFRPGWI